MIFRRKKKEEKLENLEGEKERKMKKKEGRETSVKCEEPIFLILELKVKYHTEISCVGTSRHRRGCCRGNDCHDRPRTSQARYTHPCCHSCPNSRRCPGHRSPRPTRSPPARPTAPPSGRPSGSALTSPRSLFRTVAPSAVTRSPVPTSRSWSSGAPRPQRPDNLRTRPRRLL